MDISGIIEQRFDNIFPKGEDRKIEPVGILIHSIAKELEGKPAWEWLEDKYNEIYSSAHFFVGRDFIIQCIPTNIRANHAGVSEHLGLTNLNKHYIGIEVLANFTYKDWKDYARFNKVINLSGNWQTDIDQPVYYMDQLILTNALVNHLLSTIPTIEPSRIERHSVVSPDSLRGTGKGKQDPGKAFPWSTFKKNIIIPPERKI